jgi:hypothetical protein
LPEGQGQGEFTDHEGLCGCVRGLAMWLEVTSRNAKMRVEFIAVEIAD